MSKAPRVKPQKTKATSDCGKFYIYTYWKPCVLKDGSIVYHKHINRRAVTIRPDNWKRKPRKKPDSPLTEKQKHIKKRKLLNLLKNKILKDNTYTLENTQKLYDMCRLVQAF